MGFFLMACSFVCAQSDLTEERFQERSLSLRTALHYDPLIDSSLDSLVKLYTDAERADELIGVYQGHITQYPDDAGAKTVLVRILRKLERDGVEQQLAAAAQLHPDFAAIQYVLYRFLDENSDPRALDALSKAIDLQTNPARRNEWLDELLEGASEDKGRELAAAQLKKWVDVEGQPPESYLGLARLMERYQYWELSLTALSKAKAGGLDPESGIEAEVLTATAEAALGKRQAAGKRLDAVLAKLSPDHWRRSEVMSQRIGVLATDEERAALLKKVRDRYQKNPQSEAAILDMAEILIASEKRGDAADLLADSSVELPQLELLEKRALEELRNFGDYPRFEEYLEQRLEQDPERQDLRLKLVKVRYALDKDLDAEQDLKSVLAGLDVAASSGLILETARFLEQQEKLPPAAGLLETYIASNPGRLDVVRELAEVYLKLDDRESTKKLLSRTGVETSDTENLLDLASFLVENEFLVEANRILEDRLKIDPELFDAGLLHIRVLGEIGDTKAAASRIAQVRILADTSVRYRNWLEAALQAYGLIEKEEQFFDSEQARYSYSGEDWTPQRIERFLILCELAGKRRMSDRVSQAIETQLATANVSGELKTKLRRLLVSSLKGNSDRLEEVEEQLQLLGTEDPGNLAEYELQRALLYNDAGRLDLAESILGSLDLSKVGSGELLRESIPMALKFGFRGKAIEALAAVTAIEPRDVFSWERRLSLLAMEGDELDFRSVIRSLLQDSASLRLRQTTLIDLNRHLLDSYWRSISEHLSQGELSAVLPLLDSVDRESGGGQDQLWSKWTRAYVFSETARTREAAEVLAELGKMSKNKESIVFPDGLILSLKEANHLVTNRIDDSELPTADGGNSLLQAPRMAWAFEVDHGASVLRVRPGGGSILVLDDRGQVYHVSSSTGKLVWKEHLGKPTESPPQTVSVDPEAIPDAISPDANAKLIRDLLTDSERFYLLTEEGVSAYSIKSCQLQWRADHTMGEDADLYTPSVGAWPETRLALAGESLVVFEPRVGRVRNFEAVGGKLIWERILDRNEDGKVSDSSLFSLNAGVSVERGKVFVYGLQSAVLDLETGENLWSFEEESVSEFPLTIREERNVTDQVEETPALVASNSDAGEWMRGNTATSNSEEVELIDHLHGRVSQVRETGPDQASKLVSPTVHWAKDRLGNGELALGKVGAEYLWLMQGSAIRRISLNLPLSSTRMAADGAFLGESGNHAWFLKGGGLVHVDFHQGRTFRYEASQLGTDGDLRGLVAGTRVIVRGSKGIRILNSFSGRVIAEWSWPEELLSYLDHRDPSGENRKAAGAYVWQGRIRPAFPGQPSYCFPVTDSLAGELYLTTFGTDIVVAFGTPPEAPVERNTGETTPVLPQ